MTLVAALVGAPWSGGSAPAGAAAAVSAAGAGYTFTFAQLGLAQSDTFAGPGSSVTLSLPVPAQLHPATVSGTVLVPPNFGTGTLVLQAGSVYLSSVNLPPGAPAQQKVPFSATVRAAPVTDGQASFSLVLEQANSGSGLRSRTCSSPLPLELVDGSVGYTGSLVSPSTVADFFPPVLSQLDLYVASPLTLAEQQVALSVAAEVAHDYSLIPVRVVVRPWRGPGSPPPPTQPLVRAVFIHQTSAGTGLRLPPQLFGDTLLVVQGTAAQLPMQASVLAANLRSLVQAPSASVLQADDGPSLARPSYTFGQLGLSSTIDFSGQQQLQLGLNQTELGGVLSGMAVHLVAEYTPLQPSEKGSVQVSAGNVVLGSAPLDDSGRVDLTLQVPGPALGRTTTLQLTVSYFPAGFSCRGVARAMTFTVDPRSTVSPVVAAGGHGGFPDLPQSLLPTFQVALQHQDVARLSSAVATVCGLQRMAGSLLHPQAVPFGTAMAGTAPAVIVASDTAVDRTLDPPLQAVGGTAYTVDGTSRTVFRMQPPLGSIQVFDQAGADRTVVLVTSSGSWQPVASLFRWLGDTGTRWSSLTGDVLAVAPNRNPPADVTVRAGGPSQFTPDAGRGVWLYLAIGLAFLAAVAAVVLWVALRRRRAHREEA